MSVPALALLLVLCAAEFSPLDRPLETADLEGTSLRELTLLRNAIYARAGVRFRRPWVRAHFESQAWYTPADSAGGKTLTDLDRANLLLIVAYEASVPKEELIERRAALLASSGHTPEDAIELQLLAERLGIPDPDSSASGPLHDPSLLDRRLTVDDLHDATRRDLKMIRHMVRARRGQIFERDLLRYYFARYAWYAPDPGYTDERLSPVDLANLEFLSSLEDELGGPLRDDDEEIWLAFA